MVLVRWDGELLIILKTKKEPTRLKYLDPIFYAHNLGAALLLTENFAPGYYPFPEQISEKIIKVWQNQHQETLII